ncbi:MAG: regulatory iron-sulfur-containing complex subunit RicT, partial [Clostridia bacterium]|nr:regulatory iron-sulfur-containing complex subunit RicT [Clostridia bacterium]
MIRIIGVRFKENGKIYYFSPGELTPQRGDHVIVETARGPEYGEVVMPITDIQDEELVSPLKEVIRIATAADAKQMEANRRKEKEAFDICVKKIEKHKLEMKLIQVEYSFDGNKILFYFTANGRV